MQHGCLNSNMTHTRIPLLLWVGCIIVLLCSIACSSGEIRQTKKIQTGDSLPFMHSVGVSTLISDSGVIRYHLVAEEWDIYTPNNKAATWKFYKGLLMLRLDEDFNVDLYVQADTAYLHEQTTWELRGRVRIRNVQGTRFNTEELFWNLDKHEMWNHTYMTIITPERTLEGTEFRSNEQMTRYSVANSKGDFPMSDTEDGATTPADSSHTATPQTPEPKMPGLDANKASEPAHVPKMQVKQQQNSSTASPAKLITPTRSKHGEKISTI